MASWQSAALRCAVLAVAVTFLSAATARAMVHPELRRSIPANGDTLRRPPAELRLSFSEPLELAFSSIVLTDLEGSSIAVGEITAPSSRTLVASLPRPLGQGSYLVRWQVVGDDGHPVHGEFNFTVLALSSDEGGGSANQDEDSGGRRSAVQPSVSVPAPPEGFGVLSPLYVAIRFVTFAALLTLLGVVFFQSLVLRLLERRVGSSFQEFIGAMRNQCASVGSAAAGILLVNSIAQLAAQSIAVSHPGMDLDAGMLGNLVFRTAWGHVWSLQLLGAAGAMWACSAARKVQRAWTWVAVATIALAATPALAGHASTVGRFGVLPVLADTLHVVGAGGWLGTLAVLCLVGLRQSRTVPPERRGQAVAALVNSFSPVALSFAGVAVITGTFAAWLHLEVVAALWTSAYGRTLLVKLGVLSVVVATGFYNWRRVRPSLGDERSTRRLTASATTELAVALLVIAVTAVLVATPPPGGAAPDVRADIHQQQLPAPPH